MSVEMEIGDLVCRLSDLYTEYQGLYGQSQQQLRDYVTARQYSVNERFEVWSEWCHKVDYDTDSGDMALFGKMIAEGVPYRLDNGEEVDWLFFMEQFDDNTDHAIKMREKYNVTVDDVKETLIQTNFGSFRMDY